MENERPASSPKQNEIWGSDAIAAMLRGSRAELILAPTRFMFRPL